MSDLDTPVRRIFSVTELNTETKQLLEKQFFSVFVQGEVSNFSAPRSGHWYFTLKDDAAQIRVVMFKQANFKCNTPNVGDEILIGGQMSFYTARGDLQIIASTLKPAGLGDLQKQFDELKARLLKEGLFEKARKRPIPDLPKKIAVITSPTGAVIRDIQRIAERRAPAIPLLVFPVRVQGESAADEICRALTQAEQIPNIDLIIIARGGGSLEDMVAFNSEQTARAISACPVPVISAIGHETDTSISDFVADQYAATPSEAAELATAGFINLATNLAKTKDLLTKSFSNQIDNRQHGLEKLSYRLRNPLDAAQQAAQRLDQIEARLESAIRNRLSIHQHQFESLGIRLRPQTMTVKLSAAHQQIDTQKGRLLTALKKTDQLAKDKLAKMAGLLETLSPLATMARGYAMAVDADRNLIQSVDQLSAGDTLSVLLSDGEVKSNVSGIAKKN